MHEIPTRIYHVVVGFINTKAKLLGLISYRSYALRWLRFMRSENFRKMSLYRQEKINNKKETFILKSETQPPRKCLP